MPPYPITDPAVLAFIVIPVVLVTAFGYAVAYASRSAGVPAGKARRDGVIAVTGAVVWMALTWRAASSGVLRQWERTPPPFALLVVAIFAIAIAVAFSATGRRLAMQVPLWALVGIQGFRLPLELAMHRLYERGIMPAQMSFSGLNYDIVTGTTALIVAALVAAGRAGRRTALVWNIVGTLLLANIIVIAILATPRFQFFGPQQVNVFVTYAPFVWLPAIMVLAALLGHLLIFRALRRGGPVEKPISQRV